MYKAVLLYIFLLLIPATIFSQDSLEYYQTNSSHIQAEDVEWYSVEHLDKINRLEFFSRQCSDFYKQIRIFIQVIKYEDEVINKVNRDSKRLVELRKLRNQICRKHIDLLYKIYKIEPTVENKERIRETKWKYTAFLKDK